MQGYLFVEGGDDTVEPCLCGHYPEQHADWLRKCHAVGCLCHHYREV